MIIKFATNWKPKVHSLVPKRKDTCGSSKMGLGWTHKQEFKLRSICTNKQKRRLIEVGPKMLHKWTMNKASSQDTPWPRLGEEPLPPLLYYIIWPMVGFTSKWQNFLKCPEDNLTYKFWWKRLKGKNCALW